MAVRACAALWIIIVTMLLLNFCHNNNNNGDAFDHGCIVFYQKLLMDNKLIRQDSYVTVCVCVCVCVCV